MRADINDRFYRTFTYQGTDRVPDIEFGYWPQTIRRWLGEGMRAELTEEERNSMFPRRLDDFFGFEHEAHGILIDQKIDPPFEEEIIERRGSSVIMRDSTGIIAQRFLHDAEESSIPHFIDFPVKTGDDWQAIKQRYRIEGRGLADGEAIEQARSAQTSGRAIKAGLIGFYGMLRNWMGMERLSFAFYDCPEMVHEMVEHWAELLARQIESLPEDILIDEVDWWEDMAGKNGPLVSPALFDEFFGRGYSRVMTAAAERGCAISMVDCDGNPHDIVANWLRQGVNIMFPLEVAAGVDPGAWRDEFGMELRLRGGIDKKAVAIGGAAIDREFERIRGPFEQGGFIPHLDHLVPPDVSYDNYREYLDKKRAFIGR